MPRLNRPGSAPPHAPVPPVPLPPGTLVLDPQRGEFFVRDSGGDGPPVLLLHGWMFASDLNWWPVYRELSDRGYRVIAMDHRGHGRGLRTPEPFTLSACADDAAAVVRAMGVGPVIAVGYSMGGPIAQLMARDHPQDVRALVLCATALDWSDPYLKLFWRTMGGLRLMLGLFPTGYWNALLTSSGVPASPQRTWTAAELSRGSARDLAEAGRELGRHDASDWISTLTMPAAVVMTTRDRQVRPRKQRRLAKALGAPVFEVADDHFAVTTSREAFRAALLGALAAVRERMPVTAGRAA
jgi:pimeloyl-ACP methyl ester carboxylesterase